MNVRTEESIKYTWETRKERTKFTRHEPIICFKVWFGLSASSVCQTHLYIMHGSTHAYTDDDNNVNVTERFLVLKWILKQKKHATLVK